MCVTALLWSVGDTGAAKEYSVANIMTKSWVSTLGRGEFLGKMTCSRVLGIMQSKMKHSEKTFSMQGFVSGLNECPNSVLFFYSLKIYFDYIFSFRLVLWSVSFLDTDHQYCVME